MARLSNKIKLTLLLIISTALASWVQSCATAGNDEPDLPSNEYLNVTNMLTIAGEGNVTANLEIKADCGWTITGIPSWMTLSANSGNGNATITITCTPNPSSTDERSTVLTITSASGKIKRQVTVTQPISKEFISTNVSELQFQATSESKILSITSNTKWNILGIEDWISLSRDNGEGNTDITVTVTQNESEISRKATLTLQGTNASTRVTVTQEGRTTVLSISPTTINATAIGNIYNLAVEGDARWTASSNADWVTLSKNTGEGDAMISLTVADNTMLQTREAEITVATAKTNYTCIVKQQAATLPQINETIITDIEKYSATAKSSYQSEFQVIECGFCYSITHSEPTTKDEVVTTDDANSTTFTANITGLKSGKKYYIRAFAKSAVGINYGPVKEFTTKGNIPGNEDNPTPEV